MEPKDIRDLIDLISHSNFSTFELEHEGVKIKLVKETHGPPTVVTSMSSAEIATVPVAAAATSAPGVAASIPEAAPVTPAPEAGLIDVQSPIVGTFYRSSSPDAAAFVDIGGRVSRGQVICIVEAMKVMNEIESEHDGEVVEVVVANGQPVEFGEVLLRLRPMS
ncbi:MAG: acetyl-CoA carboxylase biotin carboxyl carrier protein [Acidobacteriota bacterium]|nr:acetyl-CoA carboxylase biotin carboxyl carrier protein [Acidobacteriota bacterium]MDH3785444.1 acetyl-CoA carboxylase biotin carboxyl carrier protein [Acidobacteriota bacterium]